MAETSNIYFERAKKHIAFLYLELDLSPIDMVKIVCDGKLVDVSDTSLTSHLVALPAMDV